LKCTLVTDIRVVLTGKETLSTRWSCTSRVIRGMKGYKSFDIGRCKAARCRK